MALKHSEDDFEYRVRAGTGAAQRYLEEYKAQTSSDNPQPVDNSVDESES